MVMTGKKLDRLFFQAGAVDVAEKLLGKVLVRRIGGKEFGGIIIETEAYGGQDDRASHASRGKTARNLPMFGEAGHSYVYQIYGLHYCFNVVVEKAGVPAAVLIRAVHPLTKMAAETDGPAKLCRAFFINQALNHIDLVRSNELFFEDRGMRIQKNDLSQTPRIGTEGREGAHPKPWRFVIKSMASS